MSEGHEIARVFVTARRAAKGLPDYPGQPPRTLAAAYSVQDAAIRLAAEPVAGWKVGKINPPLDAELGSRRLAGPIFPATVRDGRASAPAMPIFADGFGAVEAEYLLRVGTAPDPARTEWTIDDAAAHLDAVHVGLEIASSPFPGINELGPLVTISDFGNNYGLVIGDPIPDWRDRGFTAWPVRLDIDGARIGAARADAMLDGPLGAAAWLFGALAARGIALRPGQWISSGAVTGVHQVRPGARVTATFKDMSVSCSIEAAKPLQGEERMDGGEPLTSG